MKKFLSEYGIIIVAAVCILTLLAFATPLGKLITGSISKNVSDMVDTSNSFASSADREKNNIYNVKDYGAIGDGVTDDRAAIMSTFKAAIRDLPATVYFPEGEYGILTDGMHIEMPLGASDLTIKGDGKDKSTIKFLENWNNIGSWSALRLETKSEPASEDQYMKNITIKDLGIYDTDPVGNSWSTANGDSIDEETHGFTIRYAANATIDNCKISNVGDEGIQLMNCIDSKITNNVIVDCNRVAAGFGAISVSDSCRNVIVEYNNINGFASSSSSMGISIDSTSNDSKDIYVRNNKIKNMSGSGIFINATSGKISNPYISDNTISDCYIGIATGGIGQKENITIKNTNITNVDYAFDISGENNGTILVDGFEVYNVSTLGIRTKNIRDSVFSNGYMENLQSAAISNIGYDTTFKNIEINGVGLTDNSLPAIEHSTLTSGKCFIDNVKLLNCQSKIGIRRASKISNSTIDQPQTTAHISIWYVDEVTNTNVNRHIIGLNNGGTLDNVKIKITSAMSSTPAIYLTNSNCTVKNCTVEVPSGYAISEGGSADNNHVFDNTCIGGSAVKLGVNSVFENNTVN